jgi:VIT1/CCC1 family predicted Fe2+/Mn2+ transporter
MLKRFARLQAGLLKITDNNDISEVQKHFHRKRTCWTDFVDLIMSVAGSRRSSRTLVDVILSENGSVPVAERERLLSEVDSAVANALPGSALAGFDQAWRNALDPQVKVQLSEEDAADRAAHVLHNASSFSLPDESNDHEVVGSGLKAAVASFCFFSSGAIIPVIPYLFGMTGLPAVALAAGLVGIGLVATGVGVGILSGQSPLRKGLRQLAIGWGAAAVTYLLGLAFGTTLS